ncbi:MAG: holin family protein [Marinovum sp.]|nr:holin family protein [Marinovum sp.]
MGLIDTLLSTVFGGGRNAVTETLEVFRENADKGAARATDMQAATLHQFAQEFRLIRRSGFDRVMDGLNRVPRPAMAMGTLGLFVAAMVDPVWFAARMQGIALVPEPLWWLLGAIVSFYFGARHQAKGQEFQREVAAQTAHVHGVLSNIQSIEALDPATAATSATTEAEDNPALLEWHGAR